LSIGGATHTSTFERLAIDVVGRIDQKPTDRLVPGADPKGKCCDSVAIRPGNARRAQLNALKVIEK
jgi:hypothetical protein